MHSSVDVIQGFIIVAVTYGNLFMITMFLELRLFHTQLLDNLGHVCVYIRTKDPDLSVEYNTTCNKNYSRLNQDTYEDLQLAQNENSKLKPLNQTKNTNDKK